MINIFKKRMAIQDWVIYIMFVFLLAAGAIYYKVYFTPKNSLELYQEFIKANNYEEIRKFSLTGFEEHLSEEDFQYIKDNIPDLIGQFTLFEFKNKSYLVMTTTGTERLEIIAVEELPANVREYFIELSNTVFSN